MTKTKKVLLILPLLVALLFTAFMVSACGEKAATDNSTHVNNVAELKAALQNGGEITVDSDITGINEQLMVTKNVTLNLNGKTISSANSLVYDGSEGVWSLLAVRGATLTVTGNGTINATKIFTFTVQSQYEGSSVTAQANQGVENSKLIIENGTFISGGGDKPTEASVVYVIGAGSSCEIKDGTFKTETSDHTWLLNTFNASETTKSLFSVTGGTFYNFNPAATDGNGSHDTHSHVAPNYKAEQIEQTGNYKVVPSTED